MHGHASLAARVLAGDGLYRQKKAVASGLLLDERQEVGGRAFYLLVRRRYVEHVQLRLVQGRQVPGIGQGFLRKRREVGGKKNALDVRHGSASKKER